jgi:anti-anti-sigma factor
MTISVTRSAGEVTVRVSGDVDILTVPDLRLALHEVTMPGCRDAVVVDLADVTFLDATGLGVLVGAHRRAGRAGIALELRDPTPRMLRLLAMTRLDRVLRVTSALDPVA